MKARYTFKILSLIYLSLSLLLQGCFEDLDPPSPCYNLDAIAVPQQVPTSEQVYGVNLAEYQYRYLKDQALHCEVNSGSLKGKDACIEFYKDKLSINSSNSSELYSDFPGISCVHFSEIKDRDYGYCELLSTSESACRCYFNRDCSSNERCYSNQRHRVNDCGDDRNCTRCLSEDNAPELR